MANWFVLPSSNPNGAYQIQFGQGSNFGGTPNPIPADYDGDGKADLAVFQPSSSTFLVIPSGRPGGAFRTHCGERTIFGGSPTPVVGDYDGDGKADLVVFQPVTSTFFILPSKTGAAYSVQFGTGSKFGGNPIPVSGDFDGDGKTDIAVYQPGDSTLFV